MLEFIGDGQKLVRCRVADQAADIKASGFIANRKLHGEIWSKLVTEMGVVTGDFEDSPIRDWTLFG